MTQRLALFDVDGTITRRDTMFLFLRHVLGDVGAVLALVRASPTLVLHLLGRVDNATAKEVLLTTALGSFPRTLLGEKAVSFAEVVEAEVRPGADARLREHQERGDVVLLVSASLDLWLAPWAERRGLRLLSTGTRWVDDRFHGLGTPNCHGPEKATRVRGVLDPAGFAHVTGYGDSSGDTEMLALCQEVHYRPFR